MKPIYLDYAAATPLDDGVMAAMQPYLKQQFYNPSATYLAAQEVARAIETARGRVAFWLGARPSEIVFTAGGTEANNLAIHGVMRQFPGANVVVSAIEHEAVLQPASGYEHRLARVDKQGLLDLTDLRQKIDDKTVLVSVMYANNEVGTIEPIARIASLIDGIRRQRKRQPNALPLYFHTDACQAAAHLDLHADRLGVDMMTINAGKIYGPKQCGALFVRTGTVLLPQILGGGQERGLRSGTENVANIVGLAAALDLVQGRRKAEVKRLTHMRDTFIDLLTKQIPGITINGSIKHRLPGNVHVSIAGIDNERVMMQLDEWGVQCAVGSACSASNEEPSHVLVAMGLSKSQAQASLRFSMGVNTSENNVKTAVRLLVKALQA